MVSSFAVLLSLSSLVWVASAGPIGNETLQAGCTVTDYSQVSAATASCKNIIINGITVPAGKTLTLNLLEGTTLTFYGTITFGYSQWEGPLVYVTGNAITVKGASGSVLNGQGNLYWDNIGDHGAKKPKFFHVRATGGSVFEYVKLLNCPHQCVGIDSSDHVTFDHWTIDNSAGDEGVAATGKNARNTDGFDIYRSSNILVQNSNVHNQDDCICVNSGSHMTFYNLYCKGSHGLSIATGLSSSDTNLNTAYDINFLSSHVVSSMTGIHIKTIKDAAKGSISHVKYQDIVIEAATGYGIIIQQDYTNDGSTGNPGNNIPITDLTLNNVRGTVTGKYAYNVYILCGSNGCSNWNWSGVQITGSKVANKCNFTPSGFTC